MLHVRKPFFREDPGMFGIGTTELIVVGLVALLLFGNRLPSVMRSLGTGITEFKRGLNEPVREEKESEKAEKQEKA